MAEKVNIFDAMEANKRNTAILFFVMSLVFLGMAWAISYAFDMGTGGIAFAVIVILAYGLVAFYSGDGIVLSMAGAKNIDPKEYPFIYNVVEGLAMAANIPMPKIYIIDDAGINAFAVGRDPKHASLALTRGAVEKLKREELEGVIAHEISHIGNRDVLYATFAVVFVGSVAILADVFLRAFIFGGGRRDKGGGIMAIIAIAMIVLAPIIAEMVRLAISRQREYLADANGAKLTRYPEGLASALEKIKAEGSIVKAATQTTAPLYFSNPVKVGFALTATHPPIDDRIKRLRSM
ncbi:MAG: M48 family metallopeptidase [Candidatus Bilamarchaeaceae archaeon]